MHSGSGLHPFSASVEITLQTKFCPRCRAIVPVDAPWPHWRKVRHAYMASMVLILAAGPILAVDYCIMIPSTFVYLTAWGPLNGLAAEHPTCRKCGGIAAEETDVSVQGG